MGKTTFSGPVCTGTQQFTAELTAEERASRGAFIAENGFKAKGNTFGDNFGGIAPLVQRADLALIRATTTSTKIATIPSNSTILDIAVYVVTNPGGAVNIRFGNDADDDAFVQDFSIANAANKLYKPMTNALSLGGATGGSLLNVGEEANAPGTLDIYAKFSVARAAITGEIIITYLPR